MKELEKIVFTEEDMKRMKEYETQSGERIIISFEEKCEIYRNKDPKILRQTVNGIERSIWARMSLDNEDCFDGYHDEWKLKQLKDNLNAIYAVLEK